MAEKRGSSNNPNLELLVSFTELRTEFRAFTEEMRRYISGNSEKLGHIEATKADKSELKEIIEKNTDHEARLRVVEEGFWKQVGALVVIQLIVQVALTFGSHLIK